MIAEPSTGKRYLRLLMLAAIVIVIIVIVFGVINLRKNSPAKTQTASTPDQALLPVIERDGVFTSFSATAQGKVTKVNDSEIEIEDNNSKKAFKLSKNVLISQNKILDSLVNLIIRPVEAQATSSPTTIQLPPPGAPGSTNPALTPPPLINSASGSANLPLPGSKSIKDVKVGDNVFLTLSKQKENGEWMVVSIFTQP